jgi:hypothetical protein
MDCGFGVKYDEQLKILKMSDFEIANLRVKGKKTLLPWQRGMLITIRSIQALFEDMKSSYETKFILTSRVNQDPEESFFSRIRGMGGSNTHPGPVEFMNRFRLLLIGRHTDFVVQNAPVEAVEDKEDCQEEFVNVSLLTETLFSSVQVEMEEKEDLIESLLDEKDLQFKAKDVKDTKEEEEEDFDTRAKEVDNNYDENDTRRIEAQASEEIDTRSEEIDCNIEALKYVAGYIAFKLKKEFPDLAISSSLVVSKEAADCPWIEIVSRGGLLVPTTSWLNLVNCFEEDFQAFHGERFRQEAKVIKNLVKTMCLKYPNVSSHIIKKYVQVRTSVRIKYLRSKLYNASLSARRMRKNKEYVT